MNGNRCLRPIVEGACNVSRSSRSEAPVDLETLLPTWFTSCLTGSICESRTPVTVPSSASLAVSSAATPVYSVTEDLAFSWASSWFAWPSSRLRRARLDKCSECGFECCVGLVEQNPKRIEVNWFSVWHGWRVAEYVDPFEEPSEGGRCRSEVLPRSSALSSAAATSSSWRCASSASGWLSSSSGRRQTGHSPSDVRRRSNDASRAATRSCRPAFAQLGELLAGSSLGRSQGHFERSVVRYRPNDAFGIGEDSARRATDAAPSGDQLIRPLSLGEHIRCSGDLGPQALRLSAGGRKRGLTGPLLRDGLLKFRLAGFRLLPGTVS